MTKYYKTTFSIDVLSEGPFGEALSLEQIAYAITEGNCVGSNLRATETVLTGKQAAEALIDAGSEPGFFGLDEDGNEVERD